MRDEELAAADDLFMNGHAYDEHGPYDVDYASLTGLPSSSRPVPTAYDDPYADSYNLPLPDVPEPAKPPSTDVPRANSSPIDHERPLRGRRRGNRGRGHGDRGHHGRGRGRNAGRSYPMSPALSMPPDQSSSYSTLRHEEYSPLYPEQDMLHSPSQAMYQPFGVQPHINPRFASAFGWSMHPPPSSAPQGYAGAPSYFDPHGLSQGQYGTSTNWTGEWSVPKQDGSSRPGLPNSQSDAAH